MKDFTQPTNESSADGVAAVACSTTGVGAGCGFATPEVSTPPSARRLTVETSSAHTNAPVKSSLLTLLSLVVGGGRWDGPAPAVTPQYNPDPPSDKSLFDSLVMAGRFRDAIQLCRERLLAGRDPFRW